MLINPEAYGPALAPLLRKERRNALTLQDPDANARPTLESLTSDSALVEGVVDRDMAQACLAGLWLYYDFGDQAHEIAQAIHSPTGSFWHGIYHRREPDFWNSKYWFAGVRNHPVFEPLLEVARAEARRREVVEISQWLEGLRQWDPAAFVDLCQRALERGEQALADLCRRIQQCEWELLFDYCYRRAVGQE